MRTMKMMVMATLIVAVAFVTSYAFAMWSDGGPERFPLTYPAETKAVESTATAVTVASWSDGGPERFPLTYPVVTTAVAAAALPRTVEIAKWSDGGPERYSSTYVMEKAAVKDGFRFTDLLYKTVRNAERHDLGSVNDLLISENGRIKYVLLDKGGILGRGLLGMGIGETVYAVPWGALKVDPMEDKLTLDITHNELKMAPNFEKREWARLNEADYEGRVHGYYGVGEIMKSTPMMFGKGHGTYLATSFVATDVFDANGLRLGRVHDFVTDKDGRIKYVVVYHGMDMFGLGGRLTPVPWKFATADVDSRTIRIGVDFDRFKSAPIITGNNWSRFDDTEWTMAIDKHFK